MPSLPPILVSVVTPARGDTRLRSLPPTLHLGGAVCLPPGYPSDKRRGTVSYMVGRRRSRMLSLYPFGPKMIRGILPLPTSLSTLFPFTHSLTRPGGGTLHFSWLHQLSPATSCHRTGGGAIAPRDLLLAASRPSGDVILLLTSFCPSGGVRSCSFCLTVYFFLSIMN